MTHTITLRAFAIATGFAACLAAAMAQAQSFSLNGNWSGRYVYGDNRTAVEFTLELDARDNRCLGRIQEPNTFGEKSASHLFANVACLSSGVRPGREFRFIKQYDGTGGVSHAVQYSGVVSQDGNTVAGNWLILSSTSWSTGQFSMSRAR